MVEVPDYEHCPYRVFKKGEVGLCSGTGIPPHHGCLADGSACGAVRFDPPEPEMCDRFRPEALLCPAESCGAGLLKDALTGVLYCPVCRRYLPECRKTLRPKKAEAADRKGGLGAAERAA